MERVPPAGRSVGPPEGWHGRLAQAAGHRDTVPLRICRLCVEGLDVTGAGISMVTSLGNRGVVCATNDVAVRVEDLQLTLGEGPCFDAVEAGAPILVGDLRAREGLTSDRWPAFLGAADDAGVRAIFAFPLQIGAIKVGVLDLYCDRPGELTPTALAGALLAADAAAVALLHKDSGHDDRFSDDPESRTSYQLQVHQATGMVQVQLGVTIEVAFLMLRARAFASGRTLAAVATDVVERRVRFSPEDL